MTLGTGPDLLAAIVGATRRRVELERASVPLETLEARVAAMDRPPRPFRLAIESCAPVAVIAECKRRSPSRGVLRADYDPVAIAHEYEAAGAPAISVLTEPTFFDGTAAHLRAVGAAVTIPVLRKDFTIDPYQLWEARAAGADAVLLIVAALTDADLRALRQEASRLDLDALAEVHNQEELARALEAGADLIGVNNRDLRTLHVDTDTCRQLAPHIPPGVVAVAESGLRTAAEVLELAAAGYRGFLMGERFMTTAAPGAALCELLQAVSGNPGKDGSERDVRAGGLERHR